MNFWKNLHPLLRREVDGSSTNSVILNAIAEVLTQTEASTESKKPELVLLYATGQYLDTWGLWFDTVRKKGETDDELRHRISATLNKPSSTVPSIVAEGEDALNDNTNGVTVYEPWTNIFTLNASKLNGEDHLEGDYFRYGVIEVKLPTDVVSQSLVDRLLAVKPAGVFMYIKLSNGKRYLLSNNKYQGDERLYKDNFVKVLYGSEQF